MARSHAPDYWFIGSILLMVLVGLVVLSSASSAVAFEKFADNYYYLKRQVLYGAIPGLILFAFLQKVSYERIKKYSTAFFVFSLVLLLLIFVPGIGAEFGTAKSWLLIGGFSIQPSEILKVSLVLFLAAWFEKKRTEDLESIRYGVVPFIVIVGVVSFLLVLQPDIGTLAIVLAIAAVMFFVAGAHWKQFGILGLIGATGLSVLVISAPYRVARLTTFLNPELDPQGAGYQINQSLLAIGSGGFLGVGLGHSRQKFAYLPEVVSDSIFAVMAEELGFVFAAGLILLLLYIWFRMLHIAKYAPDTFSRLTVVGIATWFIAQSFLNIGAMMGLLPLTGVPLPFVSHGGTALLSVLLGAGIVARISAHTKQN